MAYVLRPHKGNDNLDGWDNSTKYDNTAIKSIEDPSGGSASIPITSIPSPFASMELVRNAFEYCSDNRNDVDGTTIYHKLVSYALDILEIFYNFDKFSNIIEIIPWFKNDLDTLLNNSDDDIRRLGETLNLYMHEDSSTFNFDIMSAIFMLNYKNGPEPINIIGGTSPTSLTIASPNDLDYVRIFLGNNHRALSNDTETFLSLYQRDPDFMKFVWTLSLQQNFTSTYPEVQNYIQKCFQKISDNNLKTDLRSISASEYSNYTSLTFQAQTTVYLAGNIAMKVRQSADLSKSDFIIKVSAGKVVNSNLPLVLPYNTYTEPNMKYVSGDWNSENKSPLIVLDMNRCIVPLDQRILPFDGTLYPYLTVDDVFQPYIMETVFPISESSFFTAAYKSADRGYLLPIKQKILEYISLEDLKGVTNEPFPRPLFEIKSNNDNIIKAIIRIPIQKGKYIEFERNYFRGQEPQIEQNKGSVVECKFNLYLYPSYHIGKDSPQRVYVIEQDTGALTKNYRYDVSAYCENSNSSLQTHKINRADKSKDSYTSFYNTFSKEFDYIMVSNGKCENIAIPLYENKGGGSRSFEFAVDFGTTNTHIEYLEKGGAPKPLEISSSNPFFLKLSSYSYISEEDITKLFDKNVERSLLESVLQEFIPESVSKNDNYSFPMRTNLCKLRDARTGQRELVSLADYSIAFGYEKQQIYFHNEVLTDLKWNRNNNEGVKAYIEELLLLIRSTIILGGGDLDKTTIKWFYPISMSPFLKSRLTTTWTSLCSDLISPSCKILPISESIAPYYYYKSEQGVSSSTCTVVSVDVGGGTSDFVAYQDNRPKFISSVRFAGNNIFGDFYGMSPSLNGFYNLYKDEFKAKIDGSSQSHNLNRIFEDILANNNSADFVSFLFSLENNVALKKQGERISLSSELQENYQLKVVFLLFYTAIMYYIAKLLKKKGISSPRYITCSGTASKIFNIIGGTENIQEFTGLIFNQILESDTTLLLKQVPNPKEITCKGGLKMTEADIDDTPRKAYFYGATKLDSIESILASDLNNPDIFVDEIVNNYKSFVKFFFGINRKFSFAQYFGIEDNGSFERYYNVLTEYAEQDFATVLEERMKDFQESDSFEDSLFFYPLSGGLFRLAAYISNPNN